MLQHNGREEPGGLEAEMLSHCLTSWATPSVGLKDNTSFPPTYFFIFTCRPTYLPCSSRNMLAKRTHFCFPSWGRAWRSRRSHDKNRCCPTTRWAKFTACVTARGEKKQEAFKLSHDRCQVNHLQRGGAARGLIWVNRVLCVLAQTQHARTWNSSGCKIHLTQRQSSFFLPHNNVCRSEQWWNYSVTRWETQRNSVVTHGRCWHRG